MKNYLIAERYAKALCQSCLDEELETAVAILFELAELYQESEAMRTSLNSPAIVLEKRQEVLRNIMSAMQAPATLTRFANVMLVRERISMLGDVSDIFETLADERLGRVRAVAMSAEKLDDSQADRLKQALSARVGRNVRLRRKVNPDILGGIIVRVAGTVIDGSVRTRMERIRQELLQYDIQNQTV